jgi:deazaflavin-dependent oxidoreductase (nitroreductase family)
MTAPGSATPTRKPWLPPRWIIRVAWVAHRGIYRISGGRLGLSKAKPGGTGQMRLLTIGRRTGRQRAAMLSYFEDGPNLVTLAMNGWGEPEPAWWLNLMAQPDAVVELEGETRPIRGRAAIGEERERLWAAMRKVTTMGDLDAYAELRGRESAVVVLEPRGTLAQTTVDS